MNALTLAALGTGFTFLMTAAGAAVVFLFKNEIKPSFQRVFLGFAAGVMIAASVWSLLIPSIEMAGEQGVPGDRKSTRLNSSHSTSSRMPSSA